MNSRGEIRELDIMTMKYPALYDVIEATSNAAQIVRNIFFSHQPVDATKKTDGSPLTEADLLANNMLRARLLSIAPSSIWFSEEGVERANGMWEEAWIIDPLDGTREFVDRRPEFSISVAWFAGGGLRLAVVINPATGECGGWSEWEGLNCWNEEGDLTRSGNAFQRRYAVVVSRSEHSKGRVAGFASRLPPMTPLGSVAYKLLLVASGASDLFFTVEPKSEWDIAGGIALVRAAGKIALRFDRKPLLFNQPGARIKTGMVVGPADLVERFFDDCVSEIAATERLIAEGVVR